MPPCLLVQAATCPPMLSSGRSLSAFGGAQEFLAVLQPQAAAPEARLEERLHPLRAVHEGVDFFELPRGEGAPAGRGRRLLREARQEHPGLADGESRLEREPDEVDPAEHGLEAGITIGENRDRKSTRLNSSHVEKSYAAFRLQKKDEVIEP